MSNQLSQLRSGVIAEAASPLAPDAEVYWVERDQKYDRIVASSRERVDDDEISWVQARATAHKRVTRAFLQRLCRRPQEGAMRHPSGIEVESDGSPSRRGFIITAQRDKDLKGETSRRVRLDNTKITRLSDGKLYLEGAVPVKIHSPDSYRENTLTDRALPTNKIEALYSRAFETLPIAMFKRSQHFSNQDAKMVADLDQFRQERVRWASLQSNGALIAQESGRIGNAWIFVVPPGHPMLQEQSAVHSAHMDNAELNHVLSILPYDMNDKWACLGALHELSHLRDGVLKLEPTRGRTRDQYLEGEHRAYSIERALAFAYSDDRLGPTLESIVARAIATIDPMIALNSLVNRGLSTVSESLDQCIEPRQPKSLSELGVRQGLYQMLIGFEVARQMCAGDIPKQMEMEKRFIELAYESSGHLPPKQSS